MYPSSSSLLNDPEENIAARQMKSSFSDKRKENVSSDRIDIIDSVRGIALLGVLLVSINSFGRPESYAINLNLKDGYSGINYYVWWIENSLFAGSMRALFSMLFGTSTILLLYRLEKRNNILSPADVYYRRMLILLGFALINSFVFLWSSDILYSYAICGLFLFPFRNLKSKYLLAIGLALLLVAGLRSTYSFYSSKALREKVELVIQAENQGTQLTPEQQSTKKTWEEFQAANNIVNLQKDAEGQKEIMLKGYVAVAKYSAKKTTWAQSEHFYRTGFWDIICFFFIGMAFFKMGILSGEKSKFFYWGLMLTGYLIGLSIAYYMLSSYIKAGFDESQYANYLFFDLYEEKRLFVALGHLGLIMLIYKYHLADGLYNIFAKVGQMTLTNYMMQAAVCAVIFYGFGFKLFGSLERYQLYYVVVGIWAFQVLFSYVWMKNFKYGPFEWIWRCMTYGKMQPLRRS